MWTYHEELVSELTDQEVGYLEIVRLINDFFERSENKKWQEKKSREVCRRCVLKIGSGDRLSAAETKPNPSPGQWARRV